MELGLLKIFIIALTFIFIGVVGGFYLARYRNIRFIGRTRNWSIGIYDGISIQDLSSSSLVNNPVITRQDVTDVKAKYTADPFMISSHGQWYMFFEVLNLDAGKGEIGLASSDDGYHWEYKSIVLKENHHLSYPHVFSWDNEIFMIPESYQAGGIYLYRSNKFPYDWKIEKKLIDGIQVDPSIFRFDATWWIFASTSEEDQSSLSLFYSDKLKGHWKEHPHSPVVKNDPNAARPAGRIQNFDGKPIRFAQVGGKIYGEKVNMFQIDELTKKKYKEHLMSSSPIDQSTWNYDAMHHIDAWQIERNHWIACVDGYTTKINFEW